MTPRLLIILTILMIGFESCTKDPNDIQKQLDNGVPLSEVIRLRGKEELIGKKYQDGIIFYIDTDFFKVYIAGLEDLSSGAIMCGNSFTSFYTSNYKIDDSRSNTNNILSLCTLDNGTAASLCNNQGWDLPSRDAALYMYQNLHQRGIGSFSNALYWTSSVQLGFGSQQNTMAFDFSNGKSVYDNYQNFNRVRPVRTINY